LYGATGYVGKLIAQLAKREPLNIILAGRNQELVAAQANKLGLEFRVFSLDSAAVIEGAIAAAMVVVLVAYITPKSTKSVFALSLASRLVRFL
jgi:short subunit dehydrogenase-like uncharacterized protein